MLIGTWNPSRGIWETDMTDMLSGRWAPFSETWPISGSMRTGRAFSRPTPVRRTPDSGYSLLRTPAAAEAEGGPRNPNRPGATMRLSDQVREEQGRGILLPTPEAKLSTSGPDYARASREGSGGDDLTTAIARLLPTPTATDSEQSGGVHPKDVTLTDAVVRKKSRGGRTSAPSDDGRLF